MLTLQMGLIAVGIVFVLFAAITAVACLGYFLMRVFPAIHERLALAVVAVAAACNLIVCIVFPGTAIMAKVAIIVCSGFFLWRVYLNLPYFRFAEHDGPLLVLLSLSSTVVYLALHCATEIAPLLLSGHYVGLY